MTTITTYAELKQNIIDHTKRSGNDMLSKLDLFIDMAESDINKDLRVREMESRTTATTSTSDRFVALPTGFKQMRQLQITVNSVLYDLDFVTLKFMTINDNAGIPTQFTITSQIEMNRVSDQAYTLEIDYWKEVTALSNSNTSTTVLTTYPMVYLAACLKHAFRWTLQYDNADYWENVFMREISKANRKSRKGQVGPVPRMMPSGGMVV